MEKGKLDIDTFGKIMDVFIRDNEIQMLITIPEGTMNAVVEDNTRIGTVIEFYILLHALESICNSLHEELDIDEEKWPDVLDNILELVKKDLVNNKTNQANGTNNDQ